MSELSITTIPSTPQPTSSAWLGCLVAVVLQMFLAVPAYAADDYRSVTVADPYLEMRTGPGSGYPIFHVVDRGENVDVIMQRTEWYLVRTDRGKEGWVDRAQMELTLQPDGNPVSFDEAGLEDFTNSKWELGVLAGDFGGANIVSLYSGYSLNPNVSVELWGSQILGNFSNGWMSSVNIVHERFRIGAYHRFLHLALVSYTRVPNQRLSRARTAPIRSDMSVLVPEFMQHDDSCCELNTRATWFSRAVMKMRK